VTDRPILFSGPMVRAILAGTKTQTRRLVKDARGAFWDHAGWKPSVEGDCIAWRPADGGEVFGAGAPSPRLYAHPGDRLWVRETWSQQDARDLGLGASHTIYAATAEGRERALATRWRPSIHMPRWASRITLPVVSVRVERLQDIDGRGVLADGVENGHANPTMGVRWENAQRMAFEKLWNSLNAKRAPWASNPWVWVVTWSKAEVRS